MNRTRLGLTLIVALLTALVVSYVVAQKLLLGETGLALLLILRDFAAAAAVLWLGGAVGTLLMPDLPRSTSLTRDALRALIGLGVLSPIVLIVGLLGMIPTPLLAWAVILSLLLLLRKYAWNWLEEIRDSVALTFSYTPDSFTLWLRRGVIALLGLALIAALAPPSGWDSLVYHLAGPQRYISIGRIDAFPENHFLGFPQLAEMLYLWVMVLARPQAAALLHAGFGGLILLTALGITRRLRHPSAGWLTIVILLVGLTFWGEFSWSYNDLATTAYITGAAALLLNALEVGRSQRDSFYLWVGLLTGMAMGTKYTAVGATLGIAVMVVWITRQDGVASIIRALAVVTGAALIAFAPWLIKNLILYANPIAPFGPGTIAFDKLDQWYYLRPGSGLSLPTLLIVPLQATVFGHEGSSPYQASIGPLLIGLLPLPLIGWKRRPEQDRHTIALLTMLIVPAYLVWIVGAGITMFTAQPRLIYQIFPALALIGALGLDGLVAVPRAADYGRLLRGLVLVMLAITVGGAVIELARINPLPVALGLEDEDIYLSNRLGTHYVAMQQVASLPETSKVLTLWEPRTLYCKNRCIPDSMIDQWWHDREVYGDPLAILGHWRDQGYTHVLIFEAGMRFLYEHEPYDPMGDEDIDAIDNLRPHMHKLWQDPVGSYTLYALDENAP